MREHCFTKAVNIFYSKIVNLAKPENVKGDSKNVDELKKIIAELCDVINNGVHIVPKYIKMNVSDMRDKVLG